MARLLVVVVVLLAVAPARVAAYDSLTISQRGRVFLPGEITIEVGQTITIKNDDAVLHHVYVESDGFEFDSGEQPPGTPVPITFAHRGSFEVRCDIHPKMLLRVRVR